MLNKPYLFPVAFASNKLIALALEMIAFTLNIKKYSKIHILTEYYKIPSFTEHFNCPEIMNLHLHRFSLRALSLISIETQASLLMCIESQ